MRGRVRAQGAPDSRAILRHVLRARVLAVYFAGLLLYGVFHAWRVVDVRQALAMLGVETALALAVFMVLGLYARATARASTYVLTDTHLTLRIGVALTLTVSLPLRAIDGVDLRCFRDGTGDVLLSTSHWPNLPYLMMWPHARPWAFRPPQPMLRGLADPQGFARALVEAIEARGPRIDVVAPDTAPAPAARPASVATERAA